MEGMYVRISGYDEYWKGNGKKIKCSWIDLSEKLIEMNRVNGFLFENFAPDSEEGTRLYLKRWKEFQIANGKTKEEADLHIKRYGQNYFPITISESIKLLKACGFRMVEILWASYMQVGILARK